MDINTKTLQLFKTGPMVNANQAGNSYVTALGGHVKTAVGVYGPGGMAVSRATVI